MTYQLEQTPQGVFLGDDRGELEHLTGISVQLTGRWNCIRLRLNSTLTGGMSMMSIYRTKSSCYRFSKRVLGVYNLPGTVLVFTNNMSFNPLFSELGTSKEAEVRAVEVPESH